MHKHDKQLITLNTLQTWIYPLDLSFTSLCLVFLYLCNNLLWVAAKRMRKRLVEPGRDRMAGIHSSTEDE